MTTSKSLLIAFALAALAAAPALAQERPDGGDRPSRYAERFITLFDTDGDGKVSLKEIEAEQARLFGAIDVDRDASLSVDEFRRRGRLIQRLRTTTLFDLLDVNGDQKLSLEEIDAPARRWFKRYDADGDGAIEARELPHLGWRRR